MPSGERRSYKGSAAATTITGSIDASTTTIVIGDSAGWPDGTSGPFFVVIDRGLASEESVKILSRSGNTLTVVTVPSTGRGANDTVASTHNAGAAIEHVFTRTDADEANRHYADATLDEHTQYLNTARHDVAARHTIGSVIPTGTPQALTLGASSSPGAANAVARSDHVHGATSAAPTAVSIGAAIPATSSEGTATTVARSDHVHGLTGGTPNALSAGQSTAAGTQNSVSRSDHQHGVPAGNPVNVATSGYPTSGGSSFFARADHVHGAPGHAQIHGFGAVAAGSSPPAGGPFYIQMGRTLGTSNASGEFTVTFSNAFPAGVFTVVAVVDNHLTVMQSVTTSNFRFQAIDVNGTVAANIAMGVSWMAMGW